jgi:hypothetical protein
MISMSRWVCGRNPSAGLGPLPSLFGPSPASAAGADEAGSPAKQAQIVAMSRAREVKQAYALPS